MKISHWKNWSIAARLICITVFPVVLMFISVVTWSYFSRYAEIQQDLQERGQLIAASLAVSSQYGVISGNGADVERTARSLLRVDKSIYQIEVFDVQNKPIVKVTDDAMPREKLQIAEAPIRREVLALNTFGERETPHISAPVPSSNKRERSDVMGMVRVTMSAGGMLDDKRHRILVGSAIACVFFLVSALFGLYLARGLTRPLDATISALRHIRGGHYAVNIEARAGGEIGELQATIVDMAESLDQFKQELEGKVLARTKALQAARDEAVKSNAEKRRLIQKVNSAVEEERKNIAIEIHDHLNALLIVVRLEAQRIQDIASKESTSHAIEEIKARAESISKHTSGLYDLARDIIKRLRPEVIDTLGLRDAVEEMVRHYDAIHPKCRFAFRALGSLPALKSEIAISAYRLIQETLSNVVKHSGATTASVEVQYQASQKMLRLIIKDNGCGFDANTIEQGIGLIGMRERVDGLGGLLGIYSAPNAGTTITIALPIREDEFSG
jgi:two-component system sensor histidine kinase UhpB